MADETQAQSPHDQSLDDLLAEYIAGEEAGSAIDRQALLAQHPQHATDLREFFANRDQFERLASPLRGSGDANRAGSQPLGKLRYFGDYELLDEVAAGGMGIVYKARQVSLNRIVAVKMILKGTLAREDDVKRFRAEAEAAASLQHPAIVAIHEVGLHEGQHYFSMDFVDGHSLAELPREQPLSARQAAEYVRDAAEAVHYAHQQGTLHRDLKPSNLLIDRQGRVRITDFGLAKKITGDSNLTLTGQILGTPSYMPPEQASGKRALISAASDIYSLGAVLYELLTGRPPFRGESPAETLRQVETLDPVSPRLLSPAAPRDLETICLKCLEKEPHKRYGTAQLLADDLGHYLRGEPIVARPVRAWQRGAKWLKRHPTAAGLVVTSVIAVLAVVGFLVGQSYNARLQHLNDQLASAKTNLETRNELLSTANSALETAKVNLQNSNIELGEASSKLETALDDVKAERARARRYLYAARMALVQRAEQENQPGRIVQLLRSVIPESPDEEDLREFEWHHLWLKYQGEGTRLHGHTSPVIAVAFSPDAAWIASGCADGTMKLWDSVSGDQLRTVTSPAGRIAAIRFTADSQQVAARAGSGEAFVWNIRDGDAGPMAEETWNRLAGWSVSQESSDNGPRELVSTVTSTDGRRTVTGKTQYQSNVIKATITVRDAGKNDPVLTRELFTNVTRLACSHDGSLIASAGLDLSVRIWEVATGAEVCTLHSGHEVECITFSPDGSRIAAGVNNGWVMIWSIPGKAVRTLQAGSQQGIGRGQATCVSFGAKGRLLAAFCGNGALCWDVVTGKKLGNLPTAHHGPGGGSYVSSRRIALSPTGGLIVGVKADNPAVEAATGLRVVNVSSGVGYGYAFSNDDSLVAEAFQTSVTVWSLNGRKPGHSFKVQNWASCVAFSPDNKLVAAGSGSQRVYQSGSLNVWEIATGRSVLPWDGILLGVWGLEFSPDGKLLAVALGNYGDYGANVGRVWLVDTATWKVVKDFRGHSGCVWSVAFSPSGKRLASASGHWGRYRPATANAVEKPPATRFGQIGSEPGEVILWDVETGHELLTIRDDLTCMYGVAFSPDGRLLATASKSGAVKIYDGTPLAQSPAYEPLPEE